MRTVLTTTALTVAFVASAGMASAATFTFGLDAEEFQDTEGFEGTFSQVYLDPGSALSGANVDDGIEVNAFAFDHNNPEADYDPFMDAENGAGEIAGLGVCSSGFSKGRDDSGSGDFGGISNCSTQYTGAGKQAGDDNLVFPEILGLTFFDTEEAANLAVQITELLVRDADHLKFDGQIAVTTTLSFGEEGHPTLLDVVDGVVQDVASLGFSSMFYFTSAASCEYQEYLRSSDGDEYQGPKCDPGTELYLTSLSVSPNPIPLPAAGWLLIGSLGGLAAMKRRRKS